MTTQVCPTCKSQGFLPSVLGSNRCSFCDGTEGGNPPGCGCRIVTTFDTRQSASEVISYCPLHAAAPELLEALEYVIGAHSIVHAQGWIERAKALTQARVAIAKAKKETM